MTDTPPPPDTEVSPARPSLLARVSVVWLIPVLALAISLGVAWQTYSERGVLVEIAFENASGISEGATELRYRDVAVGLVESVGFSDDLSEVIVGVRVDKAVAPFLDASASFWVVRPEVSLRGVSGLDTVLSGVFIEGSWDSEAGEARTAFEGLAQAPLVRPNLNGTAIVLRARDANALAAGAPILHKGIRVGYIEAPRLTETADAVLVSGFVEAPYDRTLTTATRFWDTSGFNVSLGTGGVRLDVSSLASLVEGGIIFDTLVSGGDPVEPGHEFRIFPDETAARDSLLDDPLSERLTVSATFEGTVGGLAEGAEVRFRGVPVGEVSAIAMIAENTGTRTEVLLRATLALRPDRLGLGPDASVDAALELVSDYVAQGLRARLTSANILTGNLVVELVELSDADPAALDMDAPVPALPTAPANLSDFSATAEGVFERINALPVEELLASAQGVLAGISSLVNSEDTRTLIPELTATLAETRQVLEELRSAGATESLNAALGSAEEAAQAVEIAAERLPDLSARIEGLAARTETVLASYGENSRLITGALATLRDISEAADSLRTLARTLQRNPNSLILGR